MCPLHAVSLETEACPVLEDDWNMRSTREHHQILPSDKIEHGAKSKKTKLTILMEVS